jgi:hypothetical protein
MRKTLIISTFLLLCAAWAGAQTSGSATQPSSQTGSMSQSSSDSAQTVQGCLGGSAGNFTLTSSSGTTYQLAGNTSKLSDHVGEQVEITGSASSASGSAGTGSTTSSSATSSGSMGGGQTINVQKVKRIASSCNTSR